MCTHVAMVTPQGIWLLALEYLWDQLPPSKSWFFHSGCPLWKEFVLWQKTQEQISLCRLKKLWSTTALRARWGAVKNTSPSAKSWTQAKRDPWLCDHADVTDEKWQLKRCWRLRYFLCVGHFSKKLSATVSVTSHPMALKHAAEWYRESVLWSLWSKHNLVAKIHRWTLKIPFQELRQTTVNGFGKKVLHKRAYLHHYHSHIIMFAHVKLHPGTEGSSFKRLFHYFAYDIDLMLTNQDTRQKSTVQQSHFPFFTFVFTAIYCVTHYWKSFLNGQSTPSNCTPVLFCAP